MTEIIQFLREINGLIVEFLPTITIICMAWACWVLTKTIK